MPGMLRIPLRPDVARGLGPGGRVGPLQGGSRCEILVDLSPTVADPIQVEQHEIYRILKPQPDSTVYETRELRSWKVQWTSQLEQPSPTTQLEQPWLQLKIQNCTQTSCVQPLRLVSKEARQSSVSFKKKV